MNKLYIFLNVIKASWFEREPEIHNFSMMRFGIFVLKSFINIFFMSTTKRDISMILQGQILKIKNECGLFAESLIFIFNIFP